MAKNLVGKILNILAGILCVILALLLVCNLTIIIKGTLHPERPPSVLGVTPMVVLSGSMSGSAEDHIEVGDLIFVGPAEAEELKTGDVIAFMDGSSVVTHRIIDTAVNDEGVLEFTTKGDANNAADRFPVTEGNLVGIYLSRIPKVGDFALFLQTPTGMLAFVGLPLVLFIFYDLIRRQKLAKKEKDRTAELEAELAKLRELAGQPEQE